MKDIQWKSSTLKKIPIKQSNSTGDDIFTGGNANAIESVNTTLTGEPIPKGSIPIWFPVPSGSVISFTSSFEDGGNKIYAVSGSSKYKPNDLVAYYMKLLKDAKIARRTGDVQLPYRSYAQ